MHSNNNYGNNNGSRAVWARGFMALFAIVLAMGLALAACPAEAAPFAYVTIDFDFTVSVIDTATNTVVATVPVGSDPFAVAVTPDGTHVYVANNGSNNVSVIRTATNTVVKTIPVGNNPVGVAITPDGTKVAWQHGGEDDHGGDWPHWGRGHPGWDTRLRRESGLQYCFSDRQAGQHGGGHGRGGE
jgi:YVTN family beta-propeller protein